MRGEIRQQMRSDEQRPTLGSPRIASVRVKAMPVTRKSQTSSLT